MSLQLTRRSLQAARRLTGTARLALAAGSFAAALAGQSVILNPLSTAGVSQSGFRVYNFSAYSGYSTVDKSWENALQSLGRSTGTRLPSYSSVSGVTASVGYMHGGSESGRSNFAFLYSPSYTYTIFGNRWSTMMHMLAVNGSWKLAPRWQLSSSISGVTGNFDQMIFAPTSSQALASLSGTAEALAGAILTGQTTDPAVAAGTAASAAVSPQQRLFYGNRMLTGAGQVALTYSKSSRLGISFSLSANRMQHLRESGAPASQNAYLVPQTTNGAGAASLSYMLSPRTTLSASATYGRSISALNYTQYTSGEIGLGRKLTRRWFGQFSGGGGYILPVHKISTGVTGKQWQASGGLGYRGAGHTVIGSVQRSVADFYGVGAAATLSSSVGWSWQRRGRSWALQAGGGQDKLLGKQLTLNSLGNNGVRATGGIHWNPRRSASIALQYAYVTFSGVLPNNAQAPGQLLQFAQHSVRLSFGWGSGAGILGPAIGAPAQ